MLSEKVNYDEVDNPSTVTPPETSSVEESGIDLAYEKRIM